MHSGGWCVLFFPCLWPLLLCFSCCFGSVFVLPFLSPFSLPSPGSSFPSGVVPGLSGRRLVQDFQRHPHLPPFSFAALFSFCSPSLSLLLCLTSVNKCPSVVLLAADWSGVSLRWFPTILPTRHCLWPQTGSGAVAFHTDSWNFLLDSKQSKPGSNLTPKHSLMTFWKHWVCIKIFPLSTV